MHTNNNLTNFDRTNAIIAGTVWLLAFIGYSMTVAPTLSFWDCGEFIAASNILGVPHPPGTPLYILLGRIFAMVPFVADIAVRVNYLSVISSCFTAMFGYLIVVRLLRSIIEPADGLYNKFLIYGGAVSGALITAFSFTNWINSVEAEVYGLSMLMFTAIIWLGLIYHENKESDFGKRILLLMFFLAFAGIGVHMTIFLAIPALALLFIFNKSADGKDLYFTALFFLFELYLIFALSSRPDEVAFYIPILIVFVFYLFYIFSHETVSKTHLIYTVVFLISIVPLIVPFANNLSSSSDSLFNQAAIDILELTGMVTFSLLSLFSLYSLATQLGKKNSRKNKNQSKRVFDFDLVTASWFTLVAMVLWLLLYLPKGYTSFMIVSAIATVALLAKLYKKLNWSLVIATLSVSAVILGVKDHFVAMSIGLVLLIILGLVYKLKDWRTAVLIILIAVIGYSVHVYIPIRSAHQPIINENNPSENLTATINFLERKQYGSQSMVDRMFKRRGEWSNQFGNYTHMGFWGIFSHQYGLNGNRFIIIFFVGLLGLWELIRRKKEFGLPIALLIFITSVGLILYMNFADGTRINPNTGGDYLEVRERDYFFTPVFVLFGLLVGIGLSLFIKTINDYLKQTNFSMQKVVSYILPVILLFPVITFASNYHRCDRSNNYMPFDYAYNILISCDPNAVLFTFGDNDTFPVWCLQEAYGIRTDVRNINLSLANTKWYVKQIESSFGVDMGNLSDEEIDSLRPYRDRDGTIYKIQDQVVNLIIDNNLGKRPINFSVSVSGGARKYYGKPLDSALILKGMVWDVKEQANGIEVDLERSADLYLNPDKFKYRGINDTTVYKNKTTLRLTKNMANGILMIADEYRRRKNYDKAEEAALFALEKIPYSNSSIEFLGNLYVTTRNTAGIEKLIESEDISFDKRGLKLFLSRAEIALGNKEKGYSILHKILMENQTYKPAFEELIRHYYNSNNIQQMRDLLNQWLQFNTNDAQIRSLSDDIERGIKRYEDSAGRVSR